MPDSTPSPIALFAFNRPGHTRRTVEALAANHLASESDLFVFCDGPRNPADQGAVNEVRAYADTITGFRSVSVYRQERNLGLAGSVIPGVTRVLDEHDRVVVIEDDILTSPLALRFLNTGLERYREEEKVFSITAWAPPPEVSPLPHDYRPDAYFIPRFGCWGWATWKDRWNKTDWDVSDFSDFARDRAMQKAFDRGGDDLTHMLKAWRTGLVNSWAIRFGYSQFRHGGLSLYPRHSYVDNIGLDGSGVHCDEDPLKHCDLSLSMPHPELPERIDVDEDVLASFRRFYARPPLAVRIINRLGRMLLGRRLIKQW